MTLSFSHDVMRFNIHVFLTSQIMWLRRRCCCSAIVEQRKCSFVILGSGKCNWKLGELQCFSLTPENVLLTQSKVPLLSQIFWKGDHWRLKYTEVQSQQMAFTQSPSLSNNPKILNNYLIFTVCCKYWELHLSWPWRFLAGLIFWVTGVQKDFFSLFPFFLTCIKSSWPSMVIQ